MNVQWLFTSSFPLQMSALIWSYGKHVHGGLRIRLMIKRWLTRAI